MNNTRINYSEYFRNRFQHHDDVFNNLVEQSIEIKRISKRRKRNFNEAFIQVQSIYTNNVVPNNVVPNNPTTQVDILIT